MYNKIFVNLVGIIGSHILVIFCGKPLSVDHYLYKEAKYYLAATLPALTGVISDDEVCTIKLRL